MIDLDALADLLADRIAERLAQILRAGSDAQASASPWMDVKSAAAYLDWPVQRLYKLTAAREIPHAKHDGRLVFHRGRLDEWLSGYAQPCDWMSSAERASR